MKWSPIMTYCGLFLCLSFQIYVISNQRLPTAVLQRREDLYKKRLTEAYYLFIYLELAQRYHIKNYQRIEGDVDSMILKHKSLMQTCFNERWLSNTGVKWRDVAGASR